jgi:prefoldin subunit 5
MYPGYPPYPPAPPTPEQELAMLQEQAEYLEQVISDIRGRIEELENMQE